MWNWFWVVRPFGASQLEFTILDGAYKKLKFFIFLK
jgi:hypothetical protein